MGYKIDNKGSALIYVLITIVLISILSVTLINGVLNTTLQSNKTNKIVQALDLAQMGIVYFEERIKQDIKNEIEHLKITDPTLLTDESLCNYLTGSYYDGMKIGPIEVQDPNGFEVRLNKLVVAGDCHGGYSSISFEYTSTGLIFNETGKLASGSTYTEADIKESRELKSVYKVDNLNKPFIMLNAFEGETDPIHLSVGETFIDPVTAWDFEDGDLTSSIITSGSIDINTPGTYILRYNVIDSDGNAADEVTRTIIVSSNAKPTITLKPTTDGQTSPVTIRIGTSYVDPGAIAFDKEDGDLTDKIIATNNVNTTIPGSYEVRYNVTDSFGNAADEVIRIVNVVDFKTILVNAIPNYHYAGYVQWISVEITTSDFDDHTGIVIDFLKDGAPVSSMSVATEVVDNKAYAIIKAQATLEVGSYLIRATSGTSSGSAPYTIKPASEFNLNDELAYYYKDGVKVTYSYNDLVNGTAGSKAGIMGPGEIRITDGLLFIPEVYPTLEPKNKVPINYYAKEGIYIGADIETQAADADINLIACSGPIEIDRAIFDTGTGQTDITIRSGQYISARGAKIISGRSSFIEANQYIDLTASGLQRTEVYGKHGISLTSKDIITSTTPATFFERKPTYNYSPNVRCP